MNDLQAEVASWHRREHPDARLERIGLKLAEESGEVAQALDRLLSAVGTDGSWERVAEEIGDVVIVLMVLCERLHLDLEGVVRMRWETIGQRVRA